MGHASTSAGEDASLVAAAQAGDERAFGRLVEPYRWELRVHCYRMVGSYDDAEDLVQEALLRAWRRRGTYQARSTLRAWLYRIATNACLDFLDSASRRAQPYQVPPLVESASAAGPPADVSWLQPFPNRLLGPSGEGDPEQAAVARETIELAFLVAIQRLPARQRAVLITRDVLGWSAAETAGLLETSVASVKSALQRARATVGQGLPRDREQWASSAAPSQAEYGLLRRYVEAHQRGDLDNLAALLAQDVQVTMPPHPAWLIGRDALLALTGQVFDPGSDWYHGHWRSVLTWANRQPAVAQYVQRPTAAETRHLAGNYRGQVLDVLQLGDGKITAITSFEPKHFAAFDLPLVLP